MPIGNHLKKVNFKFSCPLDAYRWIGHANHSQGKWKEAIEAYEYCFDLFVEDPFFQSEVADSYFGIGDYKRSLTVYESLLLLTPEDEEIRKKVDELKELIEKN